MPRLHAITGRDQGSLFTLPAGSAAGAAVAWFLLDGLATGANVVAASVDVRASAGTALAFPQMMQAAPSLCLYDELAKLREDLRGLPQQHQRADTPCQRG